MPRVTAFEAIDRCADPAGASHLVDRLRARDPESAARLDEDHRLLHRLAAVGSAGPYLGRICLSRAGALDVLADLDRPVRVGSGGGEELSGLAGMADAAGVASGVAEAKDLELLRIAARDLLGLDDLDAVVDQLSRLADGVLEAACAAGAPGGDLAVVAMGKLGARELNYASDIDLVLVGRGDQRAMLPLARAVLRVARAGWRVDLGLRPEGRSGPLVRSLDSYVAYWDRWARTWEFQALLKARWAAGDPDLGADWYEEACRRVWSRPFGAGEVRDVRDLKRRAEAEVARRGLTHREVKAGRGGIRDVEWAVQLLQMVHGRADPSLRVGGTVPALLALAAGGYVAQADADALAGSYRWLRTVEHRLQLVEGQPAHAVPATGAARTHLARTLGYRDRGPHSAAAQFDAELRFHQATVRSRHERLFFRPLLEAFTRPAVRPVLEPAAAEERLAAFGFSDASRTRQAVRELTAGFTRASRLWQQLLPLVLEWLSESPDPDLGLLGLRALADQHAGDQVIAVVRESAEAARQLCLFLGTGAGFTRDLLRHPDLLRRPDFLAPPGRQGPALGLRPRGGAGNAALGGAAGEARGGAGGGARGGAGGGARGGAGGGAHGGAGGRAEAAVGAAGGSGELAGRARQSLAWRQGLRSRQEGLQAFRRSEELCIAAHDVLGGVGVDDTGRDLTALAEAVLVAAVQVVGGAETLAVIAMGRLGGRELSYASDLDLLLVHDLGDSPAAASARTAAQGLLQVLNGETPAMRVYNVDTSLRPEGRQGPVARSLQSYETYYRRWAQTWERQALLRGRFVAGHAEIGERFASLATAFVWDRPLTDDDRRAIRRTKARIERERIPAGEDPRFHLKLGRGSLSDIEWTTQLLQLDHAVAATGTLDALRHLEAVGALDADDGAVLADAFRFCQLARNRLTLVRGTPADALPATGPHLHALARSLGTSATGLREEYRRVTRRSRRVVERLFYGQH